MFQPGTPYNPPIQQVVMLLNMYQQYKVDTKLPLWANICPLHMNYRQWLYPALKMFLPNIVRRLLTQQLVNIARQRSLNNRGKHRRRTYFLAKTYRQGMKRNQPAPVLGQEGKHC